MWRTLKGLGSENSVTTDLPEYSSHDIFSSKLACNLAISVAKYASGSIKLTKPGPAISVRMPSSSGSFCGAVFKNSAVKTSAISLGFLWRMPASLSAQLVE